MRPALLIWKTKCSVSTRTTLTSRGTSTLTVRSVKTLRPTTARMGGLNQQSNWAPSRTRRSKWCSRLRSTWLSTWWLATGCFPIVAQLKITTYISSVREPNQIIYKGRRHKLCRPSLSRRSRFIRSRVGTTWRAWLHIRQPKLRSNLLSQIPSLAKAHTRIAFNMKNSMQKTSEVRVMLARPVMTFSRLKKTWTNRCDRKPLIFVCQKMRTVSESASISTSTSMHPATSLTSCSTTTKLACLSPKALALTLSERAIQTKVRDRFWNRILTLSNCCEKF